MILVKKIVRLYIKRFYFTIKKKLIMVFFPLNMTGISRLDFILIIDKAHEYWVIQLQEHGMIFFYIDFFLILLLDI
jgi:hypothetical protein